MAYFSDNPTASVFQSGDLIPFNRGALDYVLDADTLLDYYDTDSLAEGVSALYYTDERVDDQVGNNLIQDGTGVSWSYDDGAGTLTPTVSLSSFTTANLSAGASGVNQYYQQVAVDLTDTQIKSLNSSPINFTGGGLGSSDPNTAFMIIGCVAKPEIATTAYTVASTIDIVDTTTGNVLYTFAGTLMSGVSTTNMYHALPNSSAGPIITAGGDIAVKAASSDPTGGNASNTCKIILAVTTINFSSF